MIDLKSKSSLLVGIFLCTYTHASLTRPVNTTEYNTTVNVRVVEESSTVKTTGNKNEVIAQHESIDPEFDEYRSISNDKRIALATALFAGGFALCHNARYSLRSDAYSIGTLMQIFGGHDLLFGSDNPISRTPLLLRLIAVYCYILS